MEWWFYKGLLCILAKTPQYAAWVIHREIQHTPRPAGNSGNINWVFLSNPWLSFLLGLDHKSFEVKTAMTKMEIGGAVIIGSFNKAKVFIKLF